MVEDGEEEEVGGSAEEEVGVEDLTEEEGDLEEEGVEEVSEEEEEDDFPLHSLIFHIFFRISQSLNFNHGAEARKEEVVQKFT